MSLVKRSKIVRFGSGRAIIHGSGRGPGLAEKTDPGANLGDLRAILRAGRDRQALPEGTVIAMIAYLHILTHIQQGNFNLKRSMMIHRLQQAIDRQGQLYAVYQR